MTADILFDPLSAEFAQDPYRIYRQLRQRDQPYFYAAQNMWLLSRYDDISTIATSPHAVRSLVGIRSPAEIAAWQKQANWHDMPYHERVVQFSLLDSDGDIHRRLRRQIFGAFRNDAIGHLEAVVQGFVDALLDDLADRQQIDFMADFAVHIPGFVIGHLLGAPASDCQQLRLWSERIVQFFDVDRSDERKRLAETATHEFFDYLCDLKRQREHNPQNDLISKMLVDEKAGLYTLDEFISTCMLVLMAGHGSTIDVLGSGMHTLLQHPQAMAELRQDETKWPTAIQELFRYEPPLPFFHRHMTSDFSIRGQTFPEGTTFGLLYGAANRDPGQFEQPDAFRINREPNRHLAFGLGAHLCLGNNLARMNMNVIFRTLLKRFSHLARVDGVVPYKPGLSVRGPKVLNISWKPA